MIRTLYCAWIVLLKCTLLVHSTGFETLDFELTDEIDMLCADINTDNFYSDYSDILDLRVRDNVQNDASSARQSVLQEEQTLQNSCSLDVPGPSNPVNTLGVNEDSSASLSLFLPGTSTSSNTTTAISSVQVQSPAGSAKRACDRVEKKDREQRRRKRQKTNTTATATETNTALMDETDVRIAVEEFNRYFGKDTKYSGYMLQGILEFAKDLAQKGLTSAHSREIVELCMASNQWLGNDVFWRMLVIFIDTLSLEVAALNRLEDKKTVILRDRKIRDKPLSECTDRSIRYVIAKCRGAEQMEMQCSLNVLESRGTADVLGVFRWLLHHVNIRCVGIACDLREAGMSNAVLGRQVEALSKEWRGTRVRIDSLALHFNLAQYREAAEIINLCSWVTVLKMHFIATDSRETGDTNQALKALLPHCPALEQLSVFGVRVGVEHIRTITAMLPQLVFLELEFFNLKKLELGQKEEKESIPAFSGLKTLKISELYNYYLYSGIEKFASLFPNLKDVQISAKNVVIPLIDALSKLHHLRSLEIINNFLQIETAEYLLDKLPTLERFSVGVKDLDSKLVHILSKYAGMHTLNLRGYYISGFLASLLLPSPLLNTLKVLCVYRHSGSSYRKDKFSAEDISSKKAAMKNFGCAVEII
ncbi:hypothetical protein NECID01_1495 [Nematocida sp. AWRm77]|nr:hypothetical protein NECID01_1495 [Nematocida sp. AWRm77]